MSTSNRRTHPHRILAALVACLWLTACASTPPGPEVADNPPPASDPAADRPPLRVGVAPSQPPLIFEDDQQQIAGLEADLARALGEALGREVTFVSMFWPDLPLELQARRIDIIMSGMSVTPERRRRVAFTEPYLVVGQQALIRAADRAELGSLEAVRATTRRVATEQASTGDAYVKEHLPAADHVTLPTLEAAVAALIDGSVDVVIHDSPSIRWQAREHAEHDLRLVPGTFTTEELAWAVHPDNEALRRAADAALARWRADGTLRTLVTRWLPPVQ